MAWSWGINPESFMRIYDYSFRKGVRLDERFFNDIAKPYIDAVKNIKGHKGEEKFRLSEINSLLYGDDVPVDCSDVVKLDQKNMDRLVHSLIDSKKEKRLFKLLCV